MVLPIWIYLMDVGQRWPEEEGKIYQEVELLVELNSRDMGYLSHKSGNRHAKSAAQDNSPCGSDDARTRGLCADDSSNHQTNDGDADY